jgi:hypothetical protein
MTQRILKRSDRRSVTFLNLELTKSFKLELMSLSHLLELMILPQSTCLSLDALVSEELIRVMSTELLN